MGSVTRTYPGIESMLRKRTPWIPENTHWRLTPYKPAPVQQQQQQQQSRAMIARGSVHTLPVAYKDKSVDIGLERQKANRAKGVVDRKEADDRSSLDIDVQGLFGEFQYTHIFGTSVAELHDTSCRSAATEKKFDGTLLPERWTVDVKVSSADTGLLRVQPHKGKNPPDLYALFVYVNYVRGMPLDSPDLPLPMLRFDGFIPAYMVFDPKYLGRGGNYWVPSNLLVTREALWDMAEKSGGRLRPAAARP